MTTTGSLPADKAGHANNIPAATSFAASSETIFFKMASPKQTANPGPFPVIKFPSSTTPSSHLSAFGK